MKTTPKFIRNPMAVLAIGLLPMTGMADSIDFEEFALFSYSDVWGSSVVDYQVVDPSSNYASVGLDVTFTNNLDADNLGTVTWRIENNSGQALTNFNVFGFLDADIDFDDNTFYNEHGTYLGNTTADQYEIDEPGYVFGDIYDNLLAGDLENANAIDAGNPEDVSFALGWGLGTLDNGAWVEASFEISLLDIGGIQHSDADSDFSYYFNGWIDQSIAGVPAPGTLLLFGLVLPFVAFTGRRKMLMK